MATYSSTGREYSDYLTALAELGLVPGAEWDQVAKAYKDLMKENHPDRFPDDPEKAQKAKDVNAAHTVLRNMGEGLRQEHALRSLGAQRAAPPQAPAWFIAVVVAPAGAGKTTGWAEREARRQSTGSTALAVAGAPRPAVHVIMAAPTVDLLNQTQADLLAQDRNHYKYDGVAAGIVVNLNHTSVPKDMSVAEALQNYFAAIPATRDAILLATHAAMIDFFPPPNPEAWDLIFDEPPECLKFLILQLPALWWFVCSSNPSNALVKAEFFADGGLDKDGKPIRVLRVSANDLMGTTPDGDLIALQRLRQIAVNYPFDGMRDYLSEFASALSLDKMVLVTEKQWTACMNHTTWVGPRLGGILVFAIITPPTYFARFRSVTIMGARLWSHLTVLLWQRGFGTDFKPDISLNLPQKHSAAQAKRLTLHYIFEEPQTRTSLAKKVGGKSLMRHVCEAVAAFHSRLKWKPFIWSAPLMSKTGRDEDKPFGLPDTFWMQDTSRGNVQKVTRVKAFDPLLRLPGNTKGLNRPEFLKTHNAALLSIVNFNPEQYDLLHALGLTDAEIAQALAYDVAYQDAMRCSARLRNGKTANNVTVLYRAMAEDIAREFEGEVKIKPYPDDLIAFAEVEDKKKRGRPPSGKANSSSTDRVRRHREAKKREKAKEKARETT